MESLAVTRVKNKVKRMVIEFHHHKNSTSHNKNVIHRVDRSKPLLSLRSPKPLDDNPDIDQDYFKNFSSDGQTIEEGIEYEREEIGFTSESPLTRIQRGIMGVLRSTLGKTKPSPTASICHERRCHCHFHEVRLISEGEQQESCFHLDDCDQWCLLHPSQTNPGKSKELFGKLMQDGVHYIEVEGTKKKKFLFLRSLFPFVHRPHLRAHLKSSTTLTAESQVTEKEDGEHGHVEKKEESKRLSDQPTMGPIEIIAMSTGVESESNPNPEEVDSHANTSRLDDSTESIMPPKAYRNSSYARRQQKPAASMLSLTKVDPESAQEKRLHRSQEPWNVVMNPVSLYAALLSTGANPPQQSRSELNLTAGFTCSNNNRAAHHRFFSDYTITPAMNDENTCSLIGTLGEDLLDMTSLKAPLSKHQYQEQQNSTLRTTTAQIHNLLQSEQQRPDSKSQSIISGLLESSQASRESYDVFLDYYGDEQGPGEQNAAEDQGEQVRPLNVPKSSRIF